MHLPHEIRSGAAQFVNVKPDSLQQVWEFLASQINVASGARAITHRRAAVEGGRFPLRSATDCCQPLTLPPLPNSCRDAHGCPSLLPRTLDDKERVHFDLAQ
jgi:hypothetical protein